MPEVQVEIEGGAKKAKEAKPPEVASKERAPAKAVSPDVKRIVRIAATDLDGTLATVRALQGIPGIGFMLANAICRSTAIDGRKVLGALNDKEIDALQRFIAEQSKAPSIPTWMLNRRKDPEDGASMHITGTTLTLKQREDVNLMKRMRCRRGIRHELGLPVRGQRTRSTGRKGRGVGVMRKAAAPKAATAPAATPKVAAAAPAKAEGKK
ncbi:MAG: 30S ribosomal protein S13 [Candidatus Aenigmatarchaeota archaeon]